MRSVRLVVASALVAGAASAVLWPGVAQAALSVNAVTGSADPVHDDGGPFAYDSSVTVDNVTAGALQFSAPFSSPRSPLVVSVAQPTDGPFAASTTYTTSSSAAAGVAQLTFAEADFGCGTSGGTLRVDDVAYDGSGKITTFAGHYSNVCDGSADAITGELRFQSSTPYRAVTQSQTSWDFGTQLVNADGWRKTFTFTNHGSATQAFSAVSTTRSAFVINADTCSTPVPPGASCHVTIAPHPTSTSAQVEGLLRLTPSGSPDLPAPSISLRVLGSDSPSFYGVVGPQRVSLNWNQLPTPIDTFVDEIVVYRGTSPAHLAVLRHVAGVSYVDHPAAGTTWYYAVRPKYMSGVLGDRSPVIAARPWPKYSAGMYHRLPAPVRWISGHRVRAGHAFSLKVLGAHGVPSAHVSAVALNVTADGSSATSRIYVYPNGSKRPAAADIAVRRGDSRSNFVLAKVGKGGRILISTGHGSVPVTVDVFGYFSASGLPSKYGMGGALHEFGWPGTLLDTKRSGHGPLPAGYYATTAVNFTEEATGHVRALLVEVTAYGSKGSGTITGFRTGGDANKTSVLTYRPGVTTSAAAILRPGLWYRNRAGAYPSLSFLNRGKKAVHLVVSILGWFDDNTYLYGQRYTPTAPVHLLGRKMSSGSTRTVAATRGVTSWTSALNQKLSATGAARSTTISLRGLGVGPAPSHGQLHAPAHIDATSSTIGVTGTGNRIGVHDAGGAARIDVWTFGRFDIYPVPRTRSYAGEGWPSWGGVAPGAVGGGLRMHLLR